VIYTAFVPYTSDKVCRNNLAYLLQHVDLLVSTIYVKSYGTYGTVGSLSQLERIIGVGRVLHEY